MKSVSECEVMARIFFAVLFVVLVTVTAHKHHPKFPTDDLLRKVACTSETERRRNEIIEKSKCGAPKDVFVALNPPAAHEQISPGAVWVKQCVGLCDYDTYGSKCVALQEVTRHIPVRVYNVKTNKETCSTYAVKEHVRCGCCAGSPDSCTPPRVFDPRKCACRCPNKKDKRFCRSKRNQIMRWNPSECKCEEVFKR